MSSATFRLHYLGNDTKLEISRYFSYICSFSQFPW